MTLLQPNRLKKLSKAFVDTVISNVRIAILDRHCMISWVNDKFTELVEYHAGELIGKPLSELNLISLSPEEFNSIHEVISSGGVWRGEVESITRSGQQSWVKVDILPVSKAAGKIESFLVFISDISVTKRALEKEKQALENMSKSEARYRAVVENQSDIMSVCKADGTRHFVNKQFCEFMGKSEHELIGTNAILLPLKGLPPDFNKLIHALTVQSPEISGVFELEKHNGKKVWISLSIRGLFDDDGQLYEILTIGRDVTELKTAEINQGRHIKELEKIAYMTSHNVRAPISELLGFLELLRINAIHTDEWEMVLSNFKNSIDNLDSYTRELGAYIFQSQSSRNT